MNTLEMSKTPKNSDKLKLIKQEEEAFEEHHSKYETSSCGRRCKVLLFYGVHIGMLIMLCYFILLGWQLYMDEQLWSNEKAPIFDIHGIPLLQKDDLIDNENGDTLGTSGKANKNIYIRNRRSPQTANGLQSKKDNFLEKDFNLLHEDESTLQEENFQENSSDLEEILEKIIENEQIGSKTKENSYINNEDTKQVINMQQIRDHKITENEDKLIIKNKILIKDTDQRTSSDLDSKFKTTIRENMNRIYHITGKDKNLSIGIYCSIVLVCGILLIITFGLCIKFLYKFIIIKMISKHKRLKEEQEYEINKRLNPLYYASPSTPGTPIDKDLRFTIKRQKYDMFCDMYG